MKLKSILILICAFFIFTISNAQKDSVRIDMKNHSAGLITGSTTGYGLSYRYRSDYKIGVQLSYGPFKNQEQFKQFTSFAFLFDLVKTEKSNLYLYQSNGFWHTKYNERDLYYHYYRPEYSQSYWNNAIGIGMEFTIQKVVGINFMMGYGAYENFRLITLSGEFGVFYKF